MGTIVILDLETGGLDACKHPLTQIAAIAVNANTFDVIESFHRLVRFREDTADPEALAVNHYDPARWAAEGIHPETVSAELLAFLSKHSTVPMMSKAGRPFNVTRLAGHNIAGFDYEFLRTWINRLDHAKSPGTRPRFFPGAFQTIDTLILATWYFECVHGADLPKPANMKLSTLAEFFKVETSGSHDALVDCELCRQILIRISGVRS